MKGRGYRVETGAPQCAGWKPAVRTPNRILRRFREELPVIVVPDYGLPTVPSGHRVVQ